MTYDRYFSRGHRHAGWRTDDTLPKRHFGGKGPKPPDPPPPPPPPPKDTDPEVEKAKAASRADLRARRGRRATVLTGGDLPEPTTVRGSLVAPGSVSKLGGA